MKSNKPLIKAHPGDAGYDICSESDVKIYPGSSAIINTGLKVAIPHGYYGQVASRSGLGFKHDIIAFPGVIDSGYRGEVKVKLYNNSDNLFKVSIGDRIAQLIVIPHSILDVMCVHESELDDSARGSDGFGSTGR